MRLQLKRVSKGLWCVVTLVVILLMLQGWKQSVIQGDQIKAKSLFLRKTLSGSSYRLVDSIRHNLASKGSTGMKFRTDSLVNYTLITDREETTQTWSWDNLSEVCGNKKYTLSGDLTVSVVITYHEQEKLFNVIHTIHSIVQRTDPQRLKEIVLVDDFSKKGDEGEIFRNYLISVFRNTKILSLHLKKHGGLIKARLAGFRAATAPVIVSMDSHMEVQTGWLEPLLAEIEADHKTLASSYLDWINPTETVDGKTIWQYVHGGSTWKTFFDWSLLFGFQDISEEEKLRRKDPTEPVISPVTVGTIFAIRKEFFTEIGEFDEKMQGWGGENLDLPIRVWMCGGRVVNVPCSHAGHKEEPKSRDYRLSWKDQMINNYRRVVEVWFDEYKSSFYDHYPGVKGKQIGNLKSRLEIRKRCPKPFSWFLNRTIPELGVPREGLAWGGVMNLATKQCICIEPDTIFKLENCVPQPERQGIFWSKEGHLRLPIHIFDVKEEDGNEIVVQQEYMSYYNNSRGKTWIHWKDGPIILQESTSKHLRCLEAQKQLLFIAKCNFQTENQKWRFRNYTSTYAEFIKGRTVGFENLHKSMKSMQITASVN